MNKKGILILAMIVVLFGGVTIYMNFFKSEKDPVLPLKEPVEVDEEVKEEPKVQIVDVNSQTRPIAVMINNHPAAWSHHAGLQDAYLVYEIITEGGITRLMALYKDKETDRIGSVRSSRHYFLDYVLENDAIYAHFGWSPQAQSDIGTLGISNINGIYDGNAYFRDRSLGVAYEHTAYTSMERLKDASKRNGYRETTAQKLLFSYQVDSVDLESQEGVVPASQITIPYSRSHTTSYTYDSVSKSYLRYMNGIPHVDAITEEQYRVKNIILIQVENYSIDGYGRQDIRNVGSGNGYFATEGMMIPITWKKSSRSAQTEYYDLNGKELVLNDGNTFVQIQPLAMTPTFEA